MDIFDSLKVKSKNTIKKIVFPEGEESRTITAASILKRECLADPILIGNSELIVQRAYQMGVEFSDIHIEDPQLNSKTGIYSDLLYQIRRDKGLSREKAKELVLDNMYYGILMVKNNDADGLVSGAVHSTADMLRPALQIIKTAPECKIVSSCFIIQCNNSNFGENGLLIFADCVVNPCPSAEELADIAITSAYSARCLCGISEPRVAMLSFSTKGSASHELVDKIQKATQIAQSTCPDLFIDGELQFDAAIIPEIAAVKAKNSSVAGKANVLIFPDLQSGNIAYKTAQYIGGANCFAVLQGLAKPCNDLSRGCSVDDIVNTAMMTSVQAQAILNQRI